MNIGQKISNLGLHIAAAITGSILLSEVGQAGDVGGNIYSSPGSIDLRLEWGSNFENSKDIVVVGDGAYSFGVNVRNNTRYRVVGTGAPAGWACRGKQVDKYINNDASNSTHVYCGSSSSNGVRVASWNLEFFDSSDPAEKQQAIADLINQYNFDVVIANEVLDAASWDQFIAGYLGNFSDWDYRISQAGCSLKQVTMWKKSAVTFLSGQDLNSATSNGIIDENSSIWDDCSGRRPYVANFAVNNSTVEFTTATIHLKAGTKPADCNLRKNQVDTFVDWANWAGMPAKNFMAIGDFNDELSGNGNCRSVDTLSSMENHSSFSFATAQPGYFYSHMMGNGLVTFDTITFQSSIDHMWMTNSMLGALETTADTYGNRANAVQANMYFTDTGEPDHNPPYVIIAK